MVIVRDEQGGCTPWKPVTFGLRALLFVLNLVIREKA